MKANLFNFRLKTTYLLLNGEVIWQPSGSPLSKDSHGLLIKKLIDAKVIARFQNNFMQVYIKNSLIATTMRAAGTPKAAG